MKAQFFNEHCNEYNVTCNGVEVLKTGLNFTSLKVNVFSFFNTSLKVKVLKLLLKYSNALLLLGYCTTLAIRQEIRSTSDIICRPDYATTQIFLQMKKRERCPIIFYVRQSLTTAYLGKQPGPSKRACRNLF